MIRTAAAIKAARQILLAYKDDPDGLETALAASIIADAVTRDEAEQRVEQANVFEMRKYRRT